MTVDRQLATSPASVAAAVHSPSPPRTTATAADAAATAPGLGDASGGGGGASSQVGTTQPLATVSQQQPSIPLSPPDCPPPPADCPPPPSAGAARPDWAAAATARTLAASLMWSSHAPSSDDAASSLRSPGWVGLSHGLPRHWAWGVFSLVEALHELYAEGISASLAEALEAEAAAEAVEGRERKVARTSASAPDGNARHGNARHGNARHVNERPGERAAAEVTAELHRRGIPINVYAGPPSQSQTPPYAPSGPRFYVSATQLAIENVFPDGAPPMPPPLREALWPQRGPDACGLARVRGLGWALAPPGADPQQLHADIWGHRPKAMPRFPHVVWKRGFAANATTQLVPSGFTSGAIGEEHYSALEQAKAPALIFDSEILHRGAETPPAPTSPAPTSPAPDLSSQVAGREGAARGRGGGNGDGGGGGTGVDGGGGSGRRPPPGAGWVSSCSVELCSFSGWEEWVRGTGGTEFSDAPEYRMLPIRASPAAEGGKSDR